MDVPEKAAVGDAVSVLFGNRWEAGRVVTVGRWYHSSGNSFPVYSVRFPDGSVIPCGNNSLRLRRRKHA